MAQLLTRSSSNVVDLDPTTGDDNPTNILANSNAIDQVFAGLVTASETATGVVELATTAECDTGTDTERACTPAGVKSSIDTNVPDASDTVAGKIEIATEAECNALSSTTLAVTPGRIPQAGDSQLGIIKTATAATTTTGTATDEAVTPAALLGQGQPLKLSAAHEFPAGSKPVAFQLRFQNVSGVLKHVFYDCMNGSSPGLINAIESPASSLTVTPTIGAAVDFAGGAGVVSSGTFSLDVPDLAGLTGTAFLSARVGYVNSCESPGGISLATSSFDVNGTTQTRPYIRLYTQTGGLWDFLTPMADDGDYISIDFTGYMPKQS